MRSNREAKRRKVELLILPTEEALKILNQRIEKTNAILHVICQALESSGQAMESLAAYSGAPASSFRQTLSGPRGLVTSRRTADCLPNINGQLCLTAIQLPLWSVTCALTEQPKAGMNDPAWDRHACDGHPTTNIMDPS